MIADADGALEAYLRVRSRPPDAGPGGLPVRADTLEPVAAPFDVILLDAYGVLNRERDGDPRCRRAHRCMARGGKTVMVVSNSAGYSRTADDAALRASQLRFRRG